ncbi:hypothetical protein Q0812_03555 [Brevundimonas sp. 2R-24]|uniref:Tetratricopeptide repeat protein n=1 Tax=Peiella sedimenti TaxID=3061083 RepID=A0ABT8SJ41_9CAUL|nr:hypothetical protein [Caulobacteraceae bacterium XZ-24]
MRQILLGFSALTLAGAPMTVADATSAMGVFSAICSQAAATVGATASPEDMRIVSGFGTGGFKADTDNAEAQTWFDHAMRLRWAFEHEEAVRAFQKAQRLDPNCGMCVWGEAWAMGANLNYNVPQATQARALAIAERARRLSADAPAWQRKLVDATVRRYRGPPARRAVNFARSLERIQRQHPEELQLRTLAADALLMANRNWWSADGRIPGEGVDRAISLIESALAQNPDDPGAIHLYIHSTEWSADPYRAVPYADRLAGLTPGSPHLVHMPSHTYYRIGRYKDATTANVGAVRAAQRYHGISPAPEGLTSIGIHNHNIHFGMAGALMAGDAEGGLFLAGHFFEAYPLDQLRNPFGQIVAGTALVNQARFGDPDVVLAFDDPGADYWGLRVMRHYARGELRARQGDADALEAELAGLREAKTGVPQPTTPFGRMASIVLSIPEKVLAGRLALLRGDEEAAVTAFREAAELQASMNLGRDPPLWWYPTRRSLGAALIAAGRLDEAKAELERSLEYAPHDPLTLYALSEVAERRGDRAEQSRLLAEARREWRGGDFSLGMV